MQWIFLLILYRLLHRQLSVAIVKSMTTRILVALLLCLFSVQYVRSFLLGRPKRVKRVRLAINRVSKLFKEVKQTVYKSRQLSTAELTAIYEIGKAIKKEKKKPEYLTQQAGRDKKVSAFSTQEPTNLTPKTDPIKVDERAVPIDETEEEKNKLEYLTQQPGSDKKVSEFFKQEPANVCRKTNPIKEEVEEKGSGEKVSEFSKQKPEKVCRKTNPIKAWGILPIGKIEGGQKKPDFNCSERIDKIEEKINRCFEVVFLVLLLLSLTIATVLRVRSRTGNETVSLLEWLIAACLLLYFSKVFYISSEGKKPEWDISVKLALGALILASLLFFV